MEQTKTTAAVAAEAEAAAMACTEAAAKKAAAAKLQQMKTTAVAAVGSEAGREVGWLVECIQGQLNHFLQNPWGAQWIQARQLG